MTAQQYSKGMNHERLRFSSMNGRQLLTRLGKITKTDKLELFIVLAREYHYDYLVRFATQKLDAIRGTKAQVVWPKEFDSLAKESAIIKEVELKRPVRKFNFD